MLEHWKTIKSQIRAGRSILLRSFFFLLILFGVYVLRDIYTDHFYGYRLLLSDGFIKYSFYALTLLFLFINWEKLKGYSIRKISSLQFAFLVAAILLFFVPAKIDSLHQDVDVILLDYLIRFLLGLFLFLTFFGLRFFKFLFQEILFLILILFPLKLSPILIDHFWEYSSSITIFGLKLLLPLTRVPYLIEPDIYRVKIGDFDAYIGPSCAGIHSLLAFTMLFLFTLFLLLQKQYRLRPLYTVWMYLIGLLAVFLLNSIRVLSILLVGAYYSKDFAINAFHNNIGAILFLLFFVMYITIFLKRAKK